MLPYLPLALGAAGLFGGSAAGQVLDRPRRFLYEDLPEALGYGPVSGFGEAFERATGLGQLIEGLDQPPGVDRRKGMTDLTPYEPLPEPSREEQIRAGMANPVVRGIGLVGDVLTDPLMFLGGGLGLGAGRAVQRLDRAVDAANAARGAAVSPLAREMASLEAVDAAGRAARATDLELAMARHADELAGVRAHAAGLPPTVPGPPGVVGTIPHPPIRTIEDIPRLAADPLNPTAVYDPAIMSALAAQEGRRFLPRTYTGSATQPQLAQQLDELGVGTMVGPNQVRLPIPPGAGMEDLLQVRGGRVFGSPAVGNPIVTPVMGVPQVPNPMVGFLEEKAAGLSAAGPQLPDLSLAASAGLDPRTAAFMRLNTPSLRAGEGHLIDAPMAQLLASTGPARDRLAAEMAAKLAGAPAGLSPLGRLWYRLTGRRPVAPQYTGFTPGNPAFDPLAAAPPVPPMRPFGG